MASDDDCLEKRTSGREDTGSERAATTAFDPPPNRPTSAYNLFFRMERRRLLQEGKDALNNRVGYTQDEVEIFALQQRLVNDPKESRPKRKHVKSHGLIGFGDMARVIASRWKLLSPCEVEYFNIGFQIEKDHHQIENEKWLQRNPSQGTCAKSRRSKIGNHERCSKKQRKSMQPRQLLSPNKDFRPDSVQTKQDSEIGNIVLGNMGCAKRLAFEENSNANYSLATLLKDQTFASRLELNVPTCSPFWSENHIPTIQIQSSINAISVSAPPYQDLIEPNSIDFPTTDASSAARTGMPDRKCLSNINPNDISNLTPFKIIAPSVESNNATTTIHLNELYEQSQICSQENNCITSFETPATGALTPANIFLKNATPGLVEEAFKGSLSNFNLKSFHRTFTNTFKFRDHTFSNSYTPKYCVQARSPNPLPFIPVPGSIANNAAALHHQAMNNEPMIFRSPKITNNLGNDELAVHYIYNAENEQFFLDDSFHF